MIMMPKSSLTVLMMQCELISLTGDVYLDIDIISQWQ